MARLKDMLEPGERELARTPTRWVAWAAVLVTVALPFLALLMLYFNDDGRMRESWSILYIFGGATAVQLRVPRSSSALATSTKRKVEPWGAGTPSRSAVQRPRASYLAHASASQVSAAPRSARSPAIWAAVGAL